LKHLQAFYYGNISWSVVKETIISDNMGFSFDNSHYFYKSFNRKVQQLVESRIIDYIIDESERLEYLTMAMKNAAKMTDDVKTPLSLYHLDNWFFAFLILLSLATMVFLLELFFNSEWVAKVRAFGFVV
jgi:hypothetical protein